MDYFYSRFNFFFFFFNMFMGHRSFSLLMNRDLYLDVLISSNTVSPKVNLVEKVLSELEWTKIYLNDYKKKIFFFFQKVEAVQQLFLSGTCYGGYTVIVFLVCPQIYLSWKSGPAEVKHWKDMLARPRTNVAQWHALKAWSHHPASSMAPSPIPPPSPYSHSLPYAQDWLAARLQNTGTISHLLS